MAQGVLSTVTPQVHHGALPLFLGGVLIHVVDGEMMCSYLLGFKDAARSAYQSIGHEGGALQASAWDGVLYL